jgi:hypothetical protein
MLSKFLNFIFSALKKEQDSEKKVVEAPKKERTYFDYDWTPNRV